MVSISRTSFSPEELVRLDSLRVPSDKNMGLIEACAGSVVVFAHYMLGMKLYYWQVRFLEVMQGILEGRVEYDRYKFLLGLTSRQIGKSTSLAVFALWASFFNKRPDKRFKSTQVLIVSRSDTQAKKLLRDVRRTYIDADRFMRAQYVDDDGAPLFWYPKNKKGKQGFFSSRLSDDDTNNSTSINWREYNSERDGEFILTGSNATSGIRCYPPTDVVLGETFTIGMVDEAAHPKIESDFWYQSLKKTGDANDAFWVFTSTPWKPSGFFFDYCDIDNRGHADYVFRCNFVFETLKYDVDAGNEYAIVQYESVMDEIKNEIAMGQHNSVKLGYYCEFVSGESTYFPPDHVNKMFDRGTVMLEACDLPCDIGVDFAGSANGHSVMTIARYDEEEDRVVRLWNKRYPKGDVIDFITEIETLMKVFNIQRIIPDDCPAGFTWINRMEKEKGWNVTPMSFRTWKVKKYGGFRAKLAKGKIVSYDDELLREEMFSMEYSQSTRQSYIQPSMGKTDDLIDAFVMASFHYLDGEDRVQFVTWEDEDDEF